MGCLVVSELSPNLSILGVNCEFATHRLPVGTTMVFCMSTVAASFPEFILLKQVMQWRLLATVFAMLLVAFTAIGWILNLLAPYW
jgi:uncharacterized membrane protein YraQ (UPF0718 family)